MKINRTAEINEDSDESYSVTIRTTINGKLTGCSTVAVNLTYDEALRIAKAQQG